MSDPEVIETLRQVQFLHELSDQLLEQLASIAEIKDLEFEEVVFRQGDEAEEVFLLLEGTVALEICASSVGCKRVLTVGAGEMLGWSPVLGSGKLSATARCLSHVKCISLRGDRVLTICEEHPQLGYEFMKRAALALAKRLNATRLQLLDMYGHQMPQVPDERGDEIAIGAD